MTVDPVRLEVFHQLLAALCEEAGALLQRAAISPNIRERRDFSCALFDGEGRLVSQAAHIPVHLGSAGDAVAAVRDTLDLAAGDVAILNDPYQGGTHLPDVTIVRPVFGRRALRPSWYLVNRAHHADIGGAVPGSMGGATDLVGEGLILPPVHLRRRGILQDDILRLVCANVRGAAERRIDLQAQEASLGRLEERLRALCLAQGEVRVQRYAAHLMDASEKVVRAVLARLPRGTWTAEDVMEDDGFGNGPFPITLRLTVRRDRMLFDFRDCAPQAEGGINANRSIVTAAAVYALRCLCPARLPTNHGLFRPLEILTRRGTLLDPEPPAAVAGGNVETSQRLVDLALCALAPVAPDRMPAASAGTMSNLSVGGRGAGGAFACYETLPGGAGAGPRGRGDAALQTHMTNTRNTPIEEQERAYPVRITAYTLRRGSGGAGAHPGGDGLVKEIEALAPMTATFLGARHRRGPSGLAGGADGRPGRLTLERRGGTEILPAKTTVRLETGDVLRVETPGGGGYGVPS